MSRTAALSFLAVASFALAGADYFVQAKAAGQSLNTYGLARYKESVFDRAAPAGNAASSQAVKKAGSPQKIKTQSQREAEREREIDEVIPEVWGHLKSSQKPEQILPQVRSNTSSGASFRRIKVQARP